MMHACSLLTARRSGAQVDHQDGDGRTVAHWCAYHGRDRMLKQFLLAGADVGKLDKEGINVMSR